MDGVHDLGGMHGFGPIERDPTERGFHAPWEAVVVAMMNAALSGPANIDEFRHGIERMEPARYLSLTYFEKWLDGLGRVLVEKGVITADALEARTAFFEQHPDAPATAALREPPAPAERKGTRTETFLREPAAPPRFAPGDRVVTRNAHPPGHTRLPRYARGKRGRIVRHHGTQVFPDTNAHGLGEQPQPLYSVAFDARELWGESAEPNHVVHLDLWESYLLPPED